LFWRNLTVISPRYFYFLLAYLQYCFYLQRNIQKVLYYTQFELYCFTVLTVIDLSSSCSFSSKFCSFLSEFASGCLGELTCGIPLKAKCSSSFSKSSRLSDGALTTCWSRNWTCKSITESLKHHLSFENPQLYEKF
jgi:hypothetical protein